ncbi:beta-xylosidase [Flavobacterium cutihirudinis]|uniref:Beta-xylosidase n=1 Tax=Flavobacterium cutihirudinis TaxID=1265740 RepID=A0A3D9FU29_9FLAO|nr:beta-galactosidase [Flavobacterium cutihirudinis]RED23444.1 beta-xylosidase [Flavobacterium cutihirudinis]
MKKVFWLFLFIFLVKGTILTAQIKTTAPIWTPDNGDGTFKNPLLWGDWPDPDLIRVDDEFYFVSTSMHYVPGCPILKSKDLVNWEMASYALEKYTEDSRYNLQGGDRYLRGSWASTIRHHNGLFYVGFCTPKWDKEKGNFSICTAKDINGPWTRTIFPEYLYDPGLFFDDDGKVYVAHGQQKLYITELNADALSVKTPQKEIYDNREYPYLEGSHLYKIKGKYYLLGSTGGTAGRQVCLRSDNIYGPYESKVIINDDHTYPGNGLHQGGMVQLKDGSWWFIIMQDRGPIGRTPNLEPVTWVDGWPMLGVDGKGVDNFKKPNVGKTYPIKVPATSDEFNSPNLGLQWQWNHNPNDKKWSLKERKGYMRLKALKANRLYEAQNTLTQRVQGPYSTGTVEMETKGLKDGNTAGFGIFQMPYAYVAIQQKGKEKNIVMVNNDTIIASVKFTGSKVWFKANVTHENYLATFEYSTDGQKFQSIGNTLKMGLGLDWTANRFALFNFSTTAAGIDGFADFNWFHFNNDNAFKKEEALLIPKKFTNPDRVRYDGKGMIIEGKEFFTYSAAFHYFRCPQELWRDRFKKIKEAGFNTVETYVPWNWHEREMPASIDDYSKFDFTDLLAWLKMAHEEFGFYTIVRPGPFICAEWSGGGYPQWLAKYTPGNDTFWLRSADPEHIKWSQHWYKAVCKAVEKEQISHKAKGEKGIILFQIENEYNHDDSTNKEVLLKGLYKSVKDNGIDIPMFTCLTEECRRSNDAELSQVFDSDNYYVGLNDAPSCAIRMTDLRNKQPDSPGFVTELQGGWFSLVTGRLSEDNYSDARHYKAINLMSLLGGASGLNAYMFFGGTHFAGWGARGMTTSYDYNAPIKENGALSPKYYVAQKIGDFLKVYGTKLMQSEGGPCDLMIDGKPAPKNLFGGVRMAPDGTKFVFLHNTDDKKPFSGKVTLTPGKINKGSEPIYNINQNGEKVLIETNEVKKEVINIPSFDVDFELADLDAKVLVIAPGKNASEGKWWPMNVESVKKASVDKSVRISKVLKKDDPEEKAKWIPLKTETSLSENGVTDFRYSYYRSNIKLTAAEAASQNKLLFNMFTRDIVNAQINGHIAKRIAPEKADAQSWPTRDCFIRIGSDVFDNQFDVSGLLKEGNNEIVVVYENLGHAHGYMPMEELAGVKRAGLSDVTTKINHELKWEIAKDLAGITEGFTQPELKTSGWKKINLDTKTELLKKGNGAQIKTSPTNLVTWYRAEFELPENTDAATTWKLLINASGNGYMYLNGHNIGRHWEAGPQREFYLPECWLRFGKNEKNVISIQLRQTENGAAIKGMEITEY